MSATILFLIYLGVMAAWGLWSLCAAARQADIRRSNMDFIVLNPFNLSRHTNGVSGSRSADATELRGRANNTGDAAANSAKTNHIATECSQGAVAFSFARKIKSHS